MLFSWTCWETLHYITARGWHSHFSAWCAITLHFSGALQPTLQVSGYELAHSVTLKKSWYTFDFLRLCNGHCICQFSWQSEGFATQKHDGSSNIYCCIAEKVVVWILSHAETFIGLMSMSNLMCCTFVSFYTLHYQNPEFFLGYRIWHTAVINWIWDDTPPPFSIFSFQEGTYMEHTYLCQQ